MNISEHLWFSAEHYWKAASRRRPSKQPEKVFFFQYWCWRDEKSKISEQLLVGSLEKFQKRDFPEICISFWFHVRRLLTRTKKRWKILNPAIRKKTLQELISMFQQCFWANMKNLCTSDVHGRIRRNQLCSELNQYFSEMLTEKISYFHSWFNIVQNSSESIRRSRITSQVLFPNHFHSWFNIVQNSSESIRRSRITSQFLFPNHSGGGGGRNDV